MGICQAIDSCNKHKVVVFHVGISWVFVCVGLLVASAHRGQMATMVLVLVCLSIHLSIFLAIKHFLVQAIQQKVLERFTSFSF